LSHFEIDRRLQRCETVFHFHQVQLRLLKSVRTLETAENRNVEVHSERAERIPLVGTDQISRRRWAIRLENSAKVWRLRGISEVRERRQARKRSREFILDIKFLQIPVCFEELVVTALSIVPIQFVVLQYGLIHLK